MYSALDLPSVILDLNLVHWRWNLISCNLCSPGPWSHAFFGEVLQKSLKVWVKGDDFEAFHLEMHVHTSNLHTCPNVCVCATSPSWLKISLLHYCTQKPTSHWQKEKVEYMWMGLLLSWHQHAIKNDVWLVGLINIPTFPIGLSPKLILVVII